MQIDFEDNIHNNIDNKYKKILKELNIFQA